MPVPYSYCHIPGLKLISSMVSISLACWKAFVPAQETTGIFSSHEVEYKRHWEMVIVGQQGKA